MTAANHVKRQDQFPTENAPDAGEPADVTRLLGQWNNTNEATMGITSAVLTQRNGDLYLRVFGAGEPEPHDWGEVRVDNVFADGIGSSHAISFTAEYDFGFLETELQANLSKGLLIVTSLNTFRDGSNRADYFSREYFYKQARTS